MKRTLVMLVLIASSAHGEIYTWTDARGTAHYTNSIYEVPGRYRAKAKVLDLGVEQKKDSPSPPQGQVQADRPAELPKAVPPDRPALQGSAQTQPETVQANRSRQHRLRRQVSPEGLSRAQGEER